LWQTLLGALVGGAVFLLAAWLLRVDELLQLWEYARRRLGRPG
jgi:hypothetical protein